MSTQTIAEAMSLLDLHAKYIKEDDYDMALKVLANPTLTHELGAAAVDSLRSKTLELKELYNSNNIQPKSFFDILLEFFNGK